MKKIYIFLLLLLPSICTAAEDLSDYSGTVYFADDFESGYSYMGIGNSHSGGGYYATMGGSVTGSEGSGCSETSGYHNTIISSEDAAQNAVQGSVYSLKTPYSGSCPDQSYSRDTTAIVLDGNKSEIYIRWYQKFTGDWNTSTVQHKFTKFFDSGYDGDSNAYKKTIHFSFEPNQEYWRHPMRNIDGHFDKGNEDRWSSDIGEDTTIWVYATEANSNQPADYRSWADTGTVTIFEIDTWYCIELHVKINTDGETADGELDAWVDGKKVFGCSGFKWYQTGEDSFGTNRLEMQHIYYNRTSNDQPTYMDNIVVGSSYIGPIESESTPTISGVTISSITP